MEIRVNVGEMDTKVKVLRCTVERNTQGAKDYKFTEHSQIFARVERRFSEMVDDTNLDSGESVELTCYKIADLTTRWRIEIAGRLFNITGIDPISRVSPVNILYLSATDNG